MRFFKKLRRQKMADRATRHLPDDMRKYKRAAMLLTYTDEQLRMMDNQRYSRRGLFDLPESFLDLFDNDDVKPYSEEATRCEEVDHRITELIKNYCDELHSPVYLVRLRTLATTIDRVKTKYGDPNKGSYQSAMSSGAEIAVSIQEELKYSSRNAKSEFLLSSAQEEGLAAAMFLLRQSGGGEFGPLFSSEDTSIYRWMTERVLASPEDVEDNVAAFRDRMNRSREIGAKLEMSHNEMHDYDALCDYPDELIDRLVQMLKDDSHVWDDFARYILAESNLNSESIVNEMLCFMQPHTQQLNIRYLSHVIPKVLRAYSALPPMDDYSKASEALRDQCAGLLNVGIAIHTTFYATEERNKFLTSASVIRDQRLVDLLIAHPQKADSIADAIRERKIADFETLDQVSSRALGEGML